MPTCCCGCTEADNCPNNVALKSPIPKCYNQPKVPNSYKPKCCYNPPCYPFAGYTTYALSYLPNCCDVRGEPKFQPSQLVMSTEPMECRTTQQLSYLPPPVVRTNPFRPCNHDMWSREPMQMVTTSRHDYVPKRVNLRENYKPPTLYQCVESPFENKTTNRLSYLDPGRVQVPLNYKPVICYEKPIAPVDCYTTQRMSYQPVCTEPRKTPPWVVKQGYVKPCGPVECTTIYNSSYIAPGCCVDEVQVCQPGVCTRCPDPPEPCSQHIRNPCAGPYPTDSNK